MLVNGGGAVTLQFQRSPFKALTRTSYIPWNQIHVIEPVVMASSGGVGISWAEEDTSLKLSYSEPCLPHHFDKMKPLLFSSHQPSRHQGPPHQRTIFADSGVVQEAVQVPGSNIIIIIIIIIAIIIIIMMTIIFSTSSAGHSLAILTQPHTPISKVKHFA